MAEGDAAASLNTHYGLVADAILRGRVVPFLGAGVNLSERPSTVCWSAPSVEYFPSGSELADYLARTFRYPFTLSALQGHCPDPASHLDLARVSQYTTTLVKEGPLNEELRAVFAPPSHGEGGARPEVQPTVVHRFLAGLRALHPDRPEEPHQLIVTTNYDDLMEQALGDGKFDLVFYKADDKPRFWHKAPGTAARPIAEPNSYPYEFFKDRPVVLKVHGTVDRADPDRASFVITEDQYIQYLSEQPVNNLLPPRVLAKMTQKHHLLFLGYSLRDWNFRVFLWRLQREIDPGRRFQSWAVLSAADAVDRKSWAEHGVDIIVLDLKAYVEGLQREIASPKRASVQ